MSHRLLVSTLALCTTLTLAAQTVPQTATAPATPQPVSKTPPNHPEDVAGIPVNYDELKVVSRQKFLSEHRHDDDEDRYFARGAGVFYLHVDGKVHALYCEPGDLVSVPANTTHWFDMGTNPEFVSIRFFHDDDGWIGHFTGNPIAEVFPTFDDLHGRRAQLA